MKARPISRRSVLKGLGVSMALPFLDAMMPKLAFGQGGASGSAALTFPRRMAVCYIPMGVLYQDYFVSGTGRNFVFSKTLQPLVSFREDLLILDGLACDKARPYTDGTGDHARANACFLTGVAAKKSTSDLSLGISMDQLAAQRVGGSTRFASLEVGCEGGRLGPCEPGYSCTYVTNLSWRNATTPAPKETNPRALFDRLFAGPNSADTQVNLAQRARYNRSILDFVMDEAHSLATRLGVADQRKVDEFMGSIRDIERRITSFTTQTPRPDMERPEDVRVNENVPNVSGDQGTDYRLHIRVMLDMLAIAFQTDMTRVACHAFAGEASNRSYRQLGISDGHHDCSHHMFLRDKMEKYAKINRFHMENYAYFLGLLKAMPEGDGSVLDNSMIMYGSGIGDGSMHNHEDLPIMVAGKGGGTLKPGRHIRYARNTPVCNLYVELLNRMGVDVDEFGDSAGRLRNLG